MRRLPCIVCLTVLLFTATLSLHAQQPFAKNSRYEDQRIDFASADTGTSPWQITWPRELYISLPAACITAGGFFIRVPEVESPALATLHADRVPAFERFIIHTDSAPGKHFATLGDAGSLFCIGIGLGSLLLPDAKRNNIVTNAILYAEGYLWTEGSVNCIKRAAGRFRPYVYNTDLPDSRRTDAEAALSFPSGHTASAAYNCFFAAMLINGYFGDTEKKYMKYTVWTLAAAIPAAEGYLRVRSGEHFITDVAAGYAIGAGFGLLIPSLHRKHSADLTLLPWSRGNASGFTMELVF